MDLFSSKESALAYLWQQTGVVGLLFISFTVLSPSCIHPHSFLLLPIAVSQAAVITFSKEKKKRDEVTLAAKIKYEPIVFQGAQNFLIALPR